jgi:cytoskeleton protein RodZ
MSVGQKLRDERIRLSIDLDSLSKNTRISRKHLEAIEADQPENCPAFFFYRSFVHQYANAVGLKAADFDAEIDLLQPAPVSILEPGVPEPFPLKAPDSIVSASNRVYFSGRGKVWGPAVALLAVVIGCSVLYNWWRIRETDAQQPRLDVPSVAESKKTPARTAAPAQRVSAPVTTSSNDRVVVAVTSKEPVWISLSAEGKAPVSAALEPGEMRTIGSKERVRLGVGSAGAVEVTLNGKSIGPIGLRGQVRVVVFTPDGFQILPPSGSVRPAPSDSPVDTGNRRPPTL